MIFWVQFDGEEQRAELSRGEFELLAEFFISFVYFSESLTSPFGNWESRHLNDQASIKSKNYTKQVS